MDDKRREGTESLYKGFFDNSTSETRNKECHSPTGNVQVPPMTARKSSIVKVSSRTVLQSRV